MLLAIAHFAFLTPLALWTFDTIRAAPMQSLAALDSGAMTGVGVVLRQR